MDTMDTAIGTTETLEVNRSEPPPAHYPMDQEAAIKADLARVEAKVDQILIAFAELGNQFEGAIGGLLDGPMGKMFGKLMGRSNPDAEVEGDVEVKG